MAERKFTRGLRKPGMAAQLRETVSQVVRETAVQVKKNILFPVFFVNFQIIFCNINRANLSVLNQLTMKQC